MSKLPSQWAASPLSEITERIVDGSHNPPSKADSGRPMLSARNIMDRKIVFGDFRLIAPEAFELEHRRTDVAAGDVLLTIVGAIGRTAVVPENLEPFALQRSVAVIKPSRAVLSEYLSFYLSSPDAQRWLDDNAKGTAQRGIYLKVLGSLQVFVPPLAEQRRIVAKLDGLMARTARARAELARIPALIAHHKRAILAAAFEGALLPIEASQLMRPIRDVLKSLDQGWSPKCESDAVLDGRTWAVMKTTAIQPIEFDGCENKKLPDALQPRPELQVAVGDVLITRAGPRSRVGITCVVRATPPQVMLCDKAYRLRVNGRLIEPAYLAIMLNAPQALDLIERMKTGISDSGLNLTQDKILSLTLPVPAIDAQSEVVHRIETAFAWLDKVAAEHAQATRLLDHLDQALLAKAFRGELVPQDPNDEPASELLARIRAAAAAPERKKRKVRA